MFNTKEGSRWWNLKVDSKEAAQRDVSEAAWMFVFCGVLSVLMSILFIKWAPELVEGQFFTGVLYISVGSLFGYRKSKWISFLMVLIATLTLCSTVINRLTDGVGGKNIFLGFIVFYAALKAIWALKFLGKNENLSSNEAGINLTRSQKIGLKMFPVLSWISSVLLVLILIVSIATQLFLFAVPKTHYEISEDNNLGLYKHAPLLTLPYRDTESGITLNYPADWQAVTPADWRQSDPSLIENIYSRDETDEYLEGFSIYKNNTEGESFTRVIDRARNNLNANEYPVFAEYEDVVDGKTAHRFDVKGGHEWNGDLLLPLKGIVYIVFVGDYHYLIEFYDHPSSFDETSKKFLDVIDSIKFELR